MTNLSNPLTLIGVILAAGALLVGCGSSNSSGNSTPSTTAASTTGSTPPAIEDTEAIRPGSTDEVPGGGVSDCPLTTTPARPGPKTTFWLNVCAKKNSLAFEPLQDPKQADPLFPADIEHPVVFVNPATVPHNFSIKTADGAPIAASKTITGKPGAPAVAPTFTVHLAAGRYIYYCSVAGHEAAGMKGTFTVG
jgi:hypothetical protein